MNKKAFPISQLAIAYGSSYPKSPESDWIREIVLSMIGIWSWRGKINYEDAMQYVSYIEEQQRMSSERKRQLNWLRDTIRKASH